MTRSNYGPDQGSSRMQLLVVFLLAVALMATLLAAALGLGLLQLGGGGGQAVVSPTPTLPATPPAEESPLPTAEPTEAPTAQPSPPPAETPGAEPEPTGQPTPGGVHTVQSGETIFSISLLYGVPMQAIIEANELANPDLLQVGQQLIIPVPPDPAAEPEVHIVQAGETILAIAEQHNVDPSALADLNGITDWNQIFVGQRLWIPGTEPEGWERPTPSPQP